LLPGTRSGSGNCRSAWPHLGCRHPYRWDRIHRC
jgi:hypothetical protein